MPSPAFSVPHSAQWTNSEQLRLLNLSDQRALSQAGTRLIKFDTLHCRQKTSAPKTSLLSSNSYPASHFQASPACSILIGCSMPTGMAWACTYSGERNKASKSDLRSSPCSIRCGLPSEASKVNFLPPIIIILSSIIPDWSFQSLFDRNIDRACPVAETSEILVSLPQNAVYAIKPEPLMTVNGSMAKYDVKASMWDKYFLAGILISSSSK